MVLRNTRITILFLVLIGLPSCKQLSRDYLKRFPKITEKTFGDVRQNVTLTVDVYSAKQSKNYFNKDLLAAGYQPIQIHIENETSHILTLRPSYITLPLTPTNRIAKLLHRNVALTVSALIYPSLLFWWQGIFVFAIPTGLAMKRSNEKITDNLKFNGMNVWDVVEIPPYSHVDRFIFVVLDEFRLPFTVRLFDEDAKKDYTFPVNAFG